MGRKPRPEPVNQGSLADIYRHFFGALIKHKPESYTLKDWMEFLFHLKDRDILCFQVVKEFEMPGLLYTAGARKVQGIGYRHVTPGTKAPTLLYVRMDACQPEFIDVEFLGGQGGADQVFSLNRSQWNWVKLHVVEKEWKKR